MAVSDPIADMLTVIRNAMMAGLERVNVPSSRLKLDIVKILKNEGYLKSFRKVTGDNGLSTIKIHLRYNEEHNCALHGLKKISTPGRRIYSASEKLSTVLNGLGLLIVSTSLGIITGGEAQARNVGGEVICKVW